MKNHVKNQVKQKERTRHLFFIDVLGPFPINLPLYKGNKELNIITMSIKFMLSILLTSKKHFEFYNLI